MKRIKFKCENCGKTENIPLEAVPFAKKWMAVIHSFLQDSSANTAVVLLGRYITKVFTDTYIDGKTNKIQLASSLKQHNHPKGCTPLFCYAVFDAQKLCQPFSCF